jgi:hypothetical protein
MGMHGLFFANASRPRLFRQAAELNAAFRGLITIFGKELFMPAKSKAQQKAAGAALSAKRGETPKSRLKGASRHMVDSMSEKELEKLAETDRRGLPERKS